MVRSEQKKKPFTTKKKKGSKLHEVLKKKSLKMLEKFITRYHGLITTVDDREMKNLLMADTHQPKKGNSTERKHQ